MADEKKPIGPTHIAGGQQQGAKGHQEDSYFLFVSPDEAVMVVGVFDGHGGDRFHGKGMVVLVCYFFFAETNFVFNRKKKINSCL